MRVSLVSEPACPLNSLPQLGHVVSQLELLNLLPFFKHRSGGSSGDLKGGSPGGQGLVWLQEID